MKNQKKYSAIPLLLILLIAFTNLTSAQVGFNNPNPDPSALVDLTAYNRGLLIPRMTSLQRMAINNPANGLMVFDTDLHVFCEYDTLSNPDKWIMVNPWKAEAQSNANVELATSGNVGIGVINPVQKLEVAGNIKATNSFLANSATFTGTVNANNFIGNGVVPSGAIIMWYGAVPPSGWKICDGTNGTPDLRGRFVVGSGTNGSPAPGDINPVYTVGATGGENRHLLTSAESGLPSHTHTANPHAHNYLDINETSDADRGAFSGGAADANEDYTNRNTDPATVIINANTAQNASQPHENRPPFYVLMYIMKQ